MEPTVIVRNGMFAEEYLLTDQFYKIDPDLFEAPTHGDAAFPMSPFSEDFFYHCYDRINYPKHLWDVLATLGDWIFPGRIPPWFELKDVVKRLAYLVERGHIKIWKLKNQRMRMVSPLGVEESALSAEDVNIAVETNRDPEVVRNQRLLEKKLAEEKRRKLAAANKPKPLKSKVGNESTSCITMPKSLEDAVNLLAVARKKIEDDKYSAKYSDEQLKEMAKSGKVPKERFVVRFSSAPIDRKTKQRILPEDNTGPIGHARDSGRHPLWMSTFDQIENADTDPELIADLFGTNYSSDNDYVLYIVDLGEDFEVNGSDVFVPNFENMKDKLKKEFAGDIPDELIDEVISEEYSVKFKEHWKAFNDDIINRGLDWNESFNTDEAEIFAESNLREEERDAFIARQKILSEIGAWEIWTGKGYTELKSQPGKAGALETLEIQHNPESVKDLIASGKIIEIPLKNSKRRKA